MALALGTIHAAVATGPATVTGERIVGAGLTHDAIAAAGLSVTAPGISVAAGVTHEAIATGPAAVRFACGVGVTHDAIAGEAAIVTGD